MKYLILAFSLLTLAAGAQTNLDANAFEAKMKDNTQLLDVRTPSEFERGYLPGAKNVDWKNQETFRTAAASLDKNKPVLVYCYSGGRSATAADYLVKQGFKEVYNLEGGYLKWTSANKKVAAPALTPPPTAKNVLEASLKEHAVVLVDFYADWCGPCKKQAPILEKLKKEWAGKVAVLKIDTDKDPEIPRRYQIDEIPTLLLFKNGKLVNRLVGYREERNLRQEVESVW